MECLTCYRVDFLEILEEGVSHKVHTLAVLGLWVEISVGLEDVEEGVGPGMAELIMWAPKVEWVLTVCSFCVNQVLIHAVVCVLSVEIWA